MKAFPKDYEALFMFSEHTPFSCEAEVTDFKSECPPDKKVKKEDLFKFKRGRGDLHVSVVTFGLAAFFWRFSGQRRAGTRVNFQMSLGFIWHINLDWSI